MKFSIRNLVTITEEILNGKLHTLCSAYFMFHISDNCLQHISNKTYSMQNSMTTQIKLLILILLIQVIIQTHYTTNIFLN